MSFENAQSGYAGAGRGASGGQLGLRTDGVLRRRFIAYLFDLVAMTILMVLFGFLITVAGFLTFGLTWLLYAFLIPGTLVLYSGVTVGGPGQATVGMRIMGLAVVDAGTGGPVGFLVAAGHALLFYIAAGTFVLLLGDLAIGLARSDRRLGHDLLASLVLVRRG